MVVSAKPRIEVVHTEPRPKLFVPDRRIVRADEFPIARERRSGRDRRALVNGQRRAPRISVIIPTLNEAKNLPHVFASLPSDVYEVILVDGYSTDDTVAVARALYPAVRVVHQTRRGKGNALRCGFRAARGDILVMLDADGSADGAEIPLFVAA